jgi:hypothetical protein
MISIYLFFEIETLSGISTIRSYDMLKDFTENNDYRIDRNMKALFVFNGISKW